MQLQDVARALNLARDVVSCWSGKDPALARWIEDGFKATLARFSFPEEHRRKIRSTNGLDRLNQGIKRRTRVVRIFPNREACLRLVTVLCIEQTEEWLSGKPCMDMNQLEPRNATELPTTPTIPEWEDTMAA